jgi:hypothetical protein
MLMTALWAIKVARLDERGKKKMFGARTLVVADRYGTRPHPTEADSAVMVISMDPRRIQGEQGEYRVSMDDVLVLEDIV